MLDRVPLMPAPGHRIGRFDLKARTGDDLIVVIRDEVRRLVDDHRDIQDLVDHLIYVDLTDYVENAEDQSGADLPLLVWYASIEHSVTANLYRSWWQAGEFVAVYQLEVNE